MEEKDIRPEPMEFVRPEAATQTGRVAAVRVDETQLATIVRAEPPLPPLYQFLLKLADQLGDVVGCALLAWLCVRDKMTGDSALVGILAVLGVNNGVRVLGGKARDAAGNIKPPPGLGAIALGLAFLGTIASHVFRTNSGTHSGFARVRVLLVAAVLSTGALVLHGCASNSDSLSRAVDGYSTFHLWAQRVCGVLTALPSPPVVRGFVGGDAGVALDASVP